MGGRRDAPSLLVQRREPTFPRSDGRRQSRVRLPACVDPMALGCVQGAQDVLCRQPVDVFFFAHCIKDTCESSQSFNPARNVRRSVVPRL